MSGIHGGLQVLDDLFKRIDIAMEEGVDISKEKGEIPVKVVEILEVGVRTCLRMPARSLIVRDEEEIPFTEATVQRDISIDIF